MTHPLHDSDEILKLRLSPRSPGNSDLGFECGQGFVLVARISDKLDTHVIWAISDQLCAGWNLLAKENNRDSETHS